MTFREEIIGDARLILGDGLEIVADLRGLDAVIVDPPYSSGATDAARKSKRPALTPESVTPRDIIQSDQMTTLGFMAMVRIWFAHLRASIVEGGHVAAFIDWRMYPMLTALSDAAGFRSNNLIVWDKGYPGLGTGFRAQHELVMLASNGPPQWYSYQYGNVLTDTRITNGQHPHEKPLQLVTALVETMTPLGGVVCDSFMGSGTTGVASVRLGRKFIGIEIDEQHFDTACRRIEEAWKQPRLFEEPRPKLVQGALDLEDAT